MLACRPHRLVLSVQAVTGEDLYGFKSWQGGISGIGIPKMMQLCVLQPTGVSWRCSPGGDGSPR